MNTTATELPGMERPQAGHTWTAASNEVELAVRAQVDKLRELGYLEDHHAGQIALAIAVARDVDRSFGRGAPSGRANLLRVMNEVLQTLPQPEAASRDKLDEAVQALLHEDVDDAPAHMSAPASVRP